MHNRHILQCIMQCVTQCRPTLVICNIVQPFVGKSYVTRRYFYGALWFFWCSHKLILINFSRLAANIAAAAA